MGANWIGTLGLWTTRLFTLSLYDVRNNPSVIVSESIENSEFKEFKVATNNGIVVDDDDLKYFCFVVGFGILYATIVLLIGHFVKSPYGKMSGELSDGNILNYIFSLTVKMSPKFGWWLMEFPATVVFIMFFIRQPRVENLEPVPIFMGIWYLKHYFNRGWYFPLSIRVAPNQKSSFSILVSILGMVLVAIHGYIHALWFGKYAPHMGNGSTSWFQDPRFIIGFLIYEPSYWSTIHSEAIMRNLRPKDASSRQKQAAYKIPYGGMFNYVTNAPYFTELTGWFGWTIMTWGPAGLIVLVISLGNLVPRAFQQHQWYLNKFKGEYPKNRKIIVPFLI